MCYESLFFFTQNNRFRRLCYKIIKYEYFDNIIIIAIVLSSIKLALDSYIADNDKYLNKISDNFDIFFTTVFTIECVLKVVSLGFFWEENTYL